MKYQVIYFSRKGNTKKVAETIASEIGVSAEDVNYARLKEDTFVILGSGCYGSKPGKNLTKFMENNDFKSRNVALFSTSGRREGAEVKAMEEELISRGAIVKDKFFCKGKFFLMNRGRPNKKDLDNAKEFAKNLKK